MSNCLECYYEAILFHRLEANAVMKSIVRRDTAESYTEVPEAFSGDDRAGGNR